MQPSPPARFPRTGREGTSGGFTLFEMLVVLVVVSMIAGLSWPRLARYLQESEVRSSAENVRRAVDQCRVRAVSEGQIYQFRYEPSGRYFLIMPAELVPEPAESEGTSRFTAEKSYPGTVRQLAKTVFFKPPERSLGDPFPTERLPQEFLAEVFNGSEYRDVIWSPPVLFHPDGSATDHYFSVQDQNLHSITLNIRSLTGTITTSKLEYLPEGSNAR